MQKINPIFVSGNIENKDVYLTSGVQPPTDFGSFIDQLKVHSNYQSYASGGSVFHINLNESIVSNKKSDFIKNMFNNYTIRYASLTPVLSVCQKCGSKFVGKKTICSNCQSDDITVWSRPVGYLRPSVRGGLSSDLRQHNYRYWMNGRLEEFLRRTVFDEEDLTINQTQTDF